MKNIFKICIIYCLIMSSCSYNDLKTYNDKTSLYFAGDTDIDFSFTKYRGGSTAVIMVPIEIGGYKSDVDRSFKMELVNDSTTATPALHFKNPGTSFIMPKDSFKVHLPLEIYNTDPELKNSKVRVYLRIIPNETFINGVNYKQSLSVYISNILIKPKIWDSVYSMFFGVYSQNKHRKILEICDISEVPDVYDGGSYNYKWNAFGRAVNNFYRDNYPQYDENNQIIEPWF
ncbi:MAG: hypothetical protein CVU13_04700 [Bacteroidetes bacterium HGW-Bacteroidetes-8]|nr:MAG: hypothetical protein CVU13_04700 [Bacteroidetes bacterium HGW-Bacteroidetes-8]